MSVVNGSDSPGSDPTDRPMTGSPRPLPSNWDPDWQRALEDWMAVENLEERFAAHGWIDRRVLDFLREKAGSA
jgi:hypothetical protein